MTSKYANNGGLHGIATHGFVSRKAFWRSVPCPTCGAAAGQDCLVVRPQTSYSDRVGVPIYSPIVHKPRQNAAEKSISPQTSLPLTDADASNERWLTIENFVSQLTDEEVTKLVAELARRTK